MTGKIARLRIWTPKIAGGSGAKRECAPLQITSEAAESGADAGDDAADERQNTAEYVGDRADNAAEETVDAGQDAGSQANNNIAEAEAAANHFELFVGELTHRRGFLQIHLSTPSDEKPTRSRIARKSYAPAVAS
jgi:hypothetical protein